MPPQHGKSSAISHYFPAWYVGSLHTKRVILASYEAGFAAQWGRRARDVVEECGEEFWGIRVRSDSSAASHWEIDGTIGGMWTAGVGGPVTGKSADLLIVDDPVKNAEEAASELMREKTWEWFQTAAMTRLSKAGAAIVLMTRWHVDDLAGKIIGAMDAGGERWEILRLPAIAEEDEDYSGIFRRAKGEPLCAELHDLDSLRARKNAMGEYGWSGLYQQRPYPRGGGMFASAKAPIVDAVHPHRRRWRWWDLAASTTGDYTVGLLLSRDDASRLWTVEDVVRGRWHPGDRDATIRRTAELDGRATHVLISEEPGSGGKAQVDALVRALAGWRVQGVRETGDKITRAGPVAAQWSIGTIRILKSEWNRTFIDEVEAFPNGRHDDQVDALSGAFNFSAAAGLNSPALQIPHDPSAREREPGSIPRSERLRERELGAGRAEWRDDLDRLRPFSR